MKKKKKTCLKCNDTGQYEACTGNLHALAKMVPCPYCIGRKVVRSSAFRYGQQVDVIAAVKSLAEFSRISGLSLHYLRSYSSETHNARQIETAMGKPGTVFWCSSSIHDDPYSEKDWN